METIFKKHNISMENAERTKGIYKYIKELASVKGMVSFDYYGTIGKLIREHGTDMEQLSIWRSHIMRMKRYSMFR